MGRPVTVYLERDSYYYEAGSALGIEGSSLGLLAHQHRLQPRPHGAGMSGSLFPYR